MPKFTPGEWWVDPNFSDTDVVVGTSDDGGVVASCFEQDEAEANARLIAKAPKMFEITSGIAASTLSEADLRELHHKAVALLADIEAD